jgi:ribosome maturation factor RimP
MSNIVEKAKEVVSPIIEKLGYEVVDIEYKKMYGENNLTIFIYKNEGVSLDDCVLVNDSLETVLDENDITNGQTYNLNISSPGLDRPIISNDDFRRSLDTEVEIIFIERVANRPKSKGTLVAFDDETLTLKIKDKETKFDRANINSVKPYIKF